MTTVTETFHDHADATDTGFVVTRAWDFRTGVDGNTITPKERKWHLDPTGTFTASGIAAGATVFELVIEGVVQRSVIVDVPEDGTHQLHDLAILANPGAANLTPSVMSVLEALTWGDFA